MGVSQGKGKDHFSGKESKADAGTEFQSDLSAELESCRGTYIRFDW
jgi:hypothetical protein